MAMPVTLDAPAQPDNSDPNVPWYKLLNRYHWFVFIVAALGWLFDCFDQQIFVLTRVPAMESLIPADTANRATVVQQYGGYATSFFLIGWAIGGLFFGVLGDRWGRAKTMLVTILLYSIFTGLSSLSTGFWDFAAYRLLTGLGVGGEFAVGVALLAETMPARARPYTLAALQALSAVGNVLAASTFILFGLWEQSGRTTPIDSWRMMFLIGSVPALLALIIRRGLKEPEAWKKAKAAQANPASIPVPGNDDAADITDIGRGADTAVADPDSAAAARAPTVPYATPPGSAPRAALQMGSYAAMFGHARWRKHALLGLVLAFSGVVGLWGVGFFTPDLIQRVQRPAVTEKVYSTEIAAARAASDAATAAQFTTLLEMLKAGTLPPPAKADQLPADLQSAYKAAGPKIGGELKILGGVTSLMINIGAFCGMFGFGYLSQRIGRKPTFAIAFICAGASTAAVFLYLDSFSQLFWMIPIMGFFQLSIFSGYAIYFPELFPTPLRSTGTSFCYNVGRFVAASGPVLQAQLIGLFAAGATSASALSGDALRHAGATMCLVFVVGLIALPFLPETRGRPLPE